MENQKAATMRRVQETFAAWKTVNDQIKALEALQQHDDPASGLKTQLQALHLESERLLSIAQRDLLTIKTPRSSSGDSTWG